MIVRPHQHWFVRLFVWHGAVLSQILFRLGLNLAMAIAAVWSFQWYEHLGIHLSTAPFSLLGIAIAIFLGFRNNASYARFTEARHLWGTLQITQRSLLRQLKGALPDDPQVVSACNQLMMAYAWSLKHQLRQSDSRNDLQRLLPMEFQEQILKSPLRTGRILLCLGNLLSEQRRAGKISDMLWQGIDHNLNVLSDVLGGCDRIHNTPIPFAYSLILHRTVYLFCTLLPFGLVADLHYMTPLISVFVSYTFLALESLAEELEDPFGTQPNDLPLESICTAIEIQQKEMDDHFPLPERLQPDSRYRLN